MSELIWYRVCSASELQPCMGMRVVIGEDQLALFRVGERVYAISALEPQSQKPVLARALVRQAQGSAMLTSPKSGLRFDLASGKCLDDSRLSVAAHPAREDNGQVFIGYCHHPETVSAVALA